MIRKKKAGRPRVIARDPGDPNGELVTIKFRMTAKAASDFHMWCLKYGRIDAEQLRILVRDFMQSCQKNWRDSELGRRRREKAQ